MASIFVTGSSDGIGLQTARQLVDGGHRVVPHSRDEARAAVAAAAVPEAAAVAIGDLSSVAGIRRAAESAGELGPYDTVIHNAGVGSTATRRPTADGYERISTVNVLGPWRANQEAYDTELQEALLAACAKLTGTELPG